MSIKNHKPFQEVQKKALVIINEQHKLMEDQKRLLDETFGEGGWSIFPIPAEGLTLEKQKELATDLHLWASGAEARKHPEHGVTHIWYPAEIPGRSIVFASPVPFLLKELALKSIFSGEEGDTKLYNVLVFHNDRREKKELPDGRITQVVAQEGWQLV